MQEFIEDPVHTSDFEDMEKRISEIFSMSVEVLMTKNPTTITEDVPLLKAQSLMSTHNVGRLPVVDSKGNLIGILAQGDIFRTLVGGNLPFDEEASFYDWMALYYDIYIDWKKRLGEEIPSLMKVFRRYKVEKVLDVASSTGEHVLALGKHKFDVWGIEPSKLIYKISEAKKNDSPDTVKKKITFVNGRYDEVVKELPSDFDAVLFLGNALIHVAHSDKNILKNISQHVTKKAILIFQIINFEKILKEKNGFREFVVRKVGDRYEEELGFLTFYTRGKDKSLMYNVAIFDSVSNKWKCRGIHSTAIMYIGTNEIESMLKKIGYKDISLYGGSHYGELFHMPFKPQESDWLQVIARK